MKIVEAKEGLMSKETNDGRMKAEKDLAKLMKEIKEHDFDTMEEIKSFIETLSKNLRTISYNPIRNSSNRHKLFHG